MIPNFTLNITNLKTTASIDGNTDVVTIVGFDLTGSLSTFSASKACEIHLPPTVGSFTEYSNLTEGQVKAWVTGSPMYIPEEGNVAEDIYKQQQTTQNNLPWN